MSAVEEILARIPMSELADRLGVDEPTAERAARQAVPALLGGIQANTDDPGGASSFARAVDQHDAALVDGGVDLRQVDATDGNKIVGHVFGPQREQVTQTLGGVGGVDGKALGQELIAKLLPILAPIVMSWLASKLGGKTSAGGASGGGLGDVLGSVLGSVLGGGAGSGAGSGAGGLGDLLGGLLGGGRK